MIKRILLGLAVLALLASPAFGARKYYTINVVDEFGEPVTSLTSITVYDDGTTDARTVYNAYTGTTEVGSSGVITTSISDGVTEFWTDEAAVKITVTDGTTSATKDNIYPYGDNRMMYPSFLTATSSTTYADASSATFGTDSDIVLAWDNSNSLFEMIPAVADTSGVGIGDTSYPCDLLLFGATSGYNLYWDASEDTLELLDNVTFAVGTGDDYTISHNGETTTVAGTHTLSGVATFSTDVVFDGTYDIKYDDNRYQLHFQDNAVLGIGGAADAAGDVTFVWDATDLDVLPAADETIWKWGNGTLDMDMWWYGSDAADYMIWDEGSAELRFQDAHLQLNDDATIIFGTGDDFTMYSDTADTLEIDPGAAGDQFKIGTSDTDAVDVTWYSDVSGAILFLDEESGTVNFGADNTGLDVVFFGATASQKAWWDQSGDEWFFGADAEGVDVTWYGDTTGNYMKWDENGSTDGSLIFEDSSIHVMDDTTVIFGDGSDVTLQYDEDGQDGLQVTGFMFGAKRVVEHLLAADTLTNAESGKVFYVAKAGAGAAADVVITLPTAEAGLEYIIIDANETSEADVTITAGTGDKINDGSAAGSYVHDTDADNYALCYLVAIDATDWVVVSSTGTWSNE